MAKQSNFQRSVSKAGVDRRPIGRWLSVMCLVVPLLAVTGTPARAEEGTILRAPFSRANLENSCGVAFGAPTGRVCAPSPITSADAETGELAVGAAQVQCRSDCRGAFSWAEIQATYELAYPAASIDFEVIFDIEEMVWAFGDIVPAAGAFREGCLDESVSYPYSGPVPAGPGLWTYRFTLSNPGGAIRPGPVVAWARLYATTAPWHAFVGEAHSWGKVESIRVTPHAIEPSTPSIRLDATGTTVKDGAGRPGKRVDLHWIGGCGDTFDVYRDGVVISTATAWKYAMDFYGASKGSYIDEPLDPGRRTYVYKICEQASTVCSNEATVSI